MSSSPNGGSLWVQVDEVWGKVPMGTNAFPFPSPLGVFIEKIRVTSSQKNKTKGCGVEPIGSIWVREHV